MKLKFLDGNTLLIDNSSIENWVRCPRLGEYTYINRLTSSEVSSALKFGEAIHLALQCRFQLCREGPVPEIVERRQHLILEQFWKTWTTPINDHRTLGMACKVISEYNQAWPETTLFQVLEGGVEIPFSVPLGVVDGVRVVSTGRIDNVIQDIDGDICVLDHKTSKFGGDFAFRGYEMSSQLKCYCHALSTRFERPCRKAIVDLLTVRQPAKVKGKGNEYVRRTYTFDNEQIEEWRVNTLNHVKSILHWNKEGYFPMSEKIGCVTPYGLCDFYSVCTLSPLARVNMLQSGAFVVNSWSPLHETNQSYLDVMALSDDQVKPSQHAVEGAAGVGPDLSDLLSLG